jgi:hypothetical protein
MRCWNLIPKGELDDALFTCFAEKRKERKKVDGEKAGETHTLEAGWWSRASQLSSKGFRRRHCASLVQGHVDLGQKKI